MSFYVKHRPICRKRSCNKLSSYAKKIAKKKNEYRALVAQLHFIQLCTIHIYINQR